MPLNKLCLEYTSNKKWLVTFIVFLFFSLFFTAVLYLRVPTDIQAHIMASYNYVNKDKSLPPNFLYFILVAFFAVFSKYKILYYASSIFLLAVALALKYYLNFFYALKIDTPSVKKNNLGFLSFALLFVFCLPGLDLFRSGDYYLGQLAPNVWHNSTVIFLFPFAILLFFKGYDLLENFNWKKWAVVFGLIIINVLIKPSLVFTIIPALFLKMLFTEKVKRQKLSIPVILLCALSLSLIIIQYFIIYLTTNSGDAATCDNCSESVGIEPFIVWQYYSSSMVISFITSLLFPLAYLLLTRGKILHDRLVKFVLTNWVFAMAIFIFFVETGARKFDGNFGWQMIVANYLLFFVFAVKLMAGFAIGTTEPGRKKILYVILSSHIAWGIFYFFRILVCKNYF